MAYSELSHGAYWIIIYLAGVARGDAARSQAQKKHRTLCFVVVQNRG